VATTGPTRTLPYDWYTDATVLRLEQQRLFGRSWQYAARLDQVAEPGQLTTAWAGLVPVILVRARDGVLRGFVNVCRHRGHVLCDGDSRRETIQCPYHAWTYALDGSLSRAPRADREPGFERDALGLVPVSVDAFGPFVFVNPDPDAAPLAETLGELPAILAEGGIDVDALAFHSRAESDEYACNWKVCVENFLECYHCAVAHPSLSKAIDVSPDAYGLEIHGRLTTQIGPSRNGGGGVYDAEGEVERGQFHFLFPSTVVNVMPGRPNLSIGPVVPLGPERTHRFLDYFVGPGVDDEWLRDYLALDQAVGAEDRALVENVQRGIASGGLPSGVLMPESEKLIGHFQSLVVDALGAADGDAATR
jgi:choline monooxygenase